MSGEECVILKCDLHLASRENQPARFACQSGQARAYSTGTGHRTIVCGCLSAQ